MILIFVLISNPLRILVSSVQLDAVDFILDLPVQVCGKNWDSFGVSDKNPSKRSRVLSHVTAKETT